MMFLICPGCGEEVDISDLQEGDRFDCVNCAGLLLELVRQEGELHLRPVPQVSCPCCSQMLEAPAHAKPGDLMSCCNRTFRLTYEFGAYALE